MPALLRYRDVVIRSVASACRLIGDRERQTLNVQNSIDLSEPFDAELVSAVSEIFNNVVLHGHGGGDPGADVAIHVEPGNHCIGVRISDTGDPFDVAAIPRPDLRALPEGGMGLHIARAFLDCLEYRPGPPNLWHLSKCMEPAHELSERKDVGRRQGRVR